MTVLLPDLTTRTVNGDDFSVGDQGDLIISAGGIGVAAFAATHWAAVWRTGQVSEP